MFHFREASLKKSLIGLSPGLDGGDGESDGFVLGVDGMQGLVQSADLAEDVVHGPTITWLLRSWGQCHTTFLSVICEFS